MKYFWHEIENLNYTEEEKNIVDIMDFISKLQHLFNQEISLFEDWDMERQLKEKFNGKVNIYVAK